MLETSRTWNRAANGFKCLNRMNTNAGSMSKPGDQMEELSQKITKKHKEMEDVREKLGNAEARYRHANICNTCARTK